MPCLQFAVYLGSRLSPTRRIYKFRLVRELVESRCDPETIDRFLEILDWLLALNASHDKILLKDLEAVLPEDKMQFITSFQRLGRKEGRKEAKREIAQRLLATGMSPEQVAELSGLPLREIIANPASEPVAPSQSSAATLERLSGSAE